MSALGNKTQHQSYTCVDASQPGFVHTLHDKGTGLTLRHGKYIMK